MSEPSTDRYGQDDLAELIDRQDNVSEGVNILTQPDEWSEKQQDKPALNLAYMEEQRRMFAVQMAVQAGATNDNVVGTARGIENYLLGRQEPEPPVDHASEAG